MADVATLAPAGDATAADQSGHPRRWATQGGWGAGAFLIGALALIALVVSRAKGVDVRALDTIHAEGTRSWAVNGYIPGIPYDPAHNPFTANRLRTLTLLLAPVYLSAVAAIGATFVSTIRGTERWPTVVRVFAGFLPGFLMVLVPLQLLFAAVGTVTAAWVALLGVPLVAVLVQRRTIVATAGRLRRNEHHDRRSLLGVLGAIVVIAGLCATWRLQAGRYFMVPDSISAFLQAGDAQLAGALGGHLALWDQQSDEWVFNAPLLFTSHTGHDQLFVFWVTQAVALASFMALVFGLAYTFAWRRRALAGLLAVGLVMASTPSIFPWDNIVIVGGQNPALWLAHPGRHISIVAPWIVLLLLARPPRRGVVAILLAAAGLAFTTVEGTAYPGVAMVCAGAWMLLRGRGLARLHTPAAWRAGRVAIHLLALAVLAAPLFVYYQIHHMELPDALGWVLAGGAVAAILAAVLLALASAPVPAPRAEPAATRRPWWKGPFALGAAAIVALVAGLFLSNNLVGGFAGGAVRHALASVLPGYGGPVLSRNVLVTDGLTFPSYAGQECDWSGHCLSFVYFLAVYGFTLVVALAGWLALGRVGDEERVNRRRAAWLISVAGLVLGLAILDFTGADHLTAWILTRFVEVPYYAVLAFAAVVFASARNRVTLIAGTGVLALWIIIPFAGDHVVQQVVKNADWLVGTLH